MHVEIKNQILEMKEFVHEFLFSKKYRVIVHNLENAEN